MKILPVATICPALGSRFVMYQFDWRMVQGTPEDFRASSSSPCQARLLNEAASAPIVDAFTTKPTPAFAAASITAFSHRTLSGPSPDDRKTRSAPSSAS